MLDVTTLNNTLFNLFNAGSNDSQTMATGIANAIDVFVKSGTVNTTGSTDAPTVTGTVSTVTTSGTIS